MKKILFCCLTILGCTLGYSQKVSTADQVKSLQTEVVQNTQKIKSLEAKVDDLKIDLERVRGLLITLLSQRDSVMKASMQPASSPQGASSYSIDSPIPKTKTTSTSTSTSYGQCRATTKKGSRCSRSAGANGYCWQH